MAISPLERRFFLHLRAPLYVRQAYDARKFAFVSDNVLLWALEREGGLYLDTDVLAFRPMDELMNLYDAFAGFEGSKHMPVGTCVLASRPHGEWVSLMLHTYDERPFIMADGSMDLTTNVTFMMNILKQGGVVSNNQEQSFLDLHILPVDYFCPRFTTGEYIRTNLTYCEHLGLNSWGTQSHCLKSRILNLLPLRLRTFLIKLKRKLIG